MHLRSVYVLAAFLCACQLQHAGSLLWPRSMLCMSIMTLRTRARCRATLSSAVVHCDDKPHPLCMQQAELGWPLCLAQVPAVTYHKTLQGLDLRLGVLAHHVLYAGPRDMHCSP